jgi:hypothetical protein
VVCTLPARSGLHSKGVRCCVGFGGIGGGAKSAFQAECTRLAP